MEAKKLRKVDGADKLWSRKIFSLPFYRPFFYSTINFIQPVFMLKPENIRAINSRKDITGGQGDSFYFLLNNIYHYKSLPVDCWLFRVFKKKKKRHLFMQKAYFSYLCIHDKKKKNIALKCLLLNVVYCEDASKIYKDVGGKPFLIVLLST